MCLVFFITTSLVVARTKWFPGLVVWVLVGILSLKKFGLAAPGANEPNNGKGHNENELGIVKFHGYLLPMSLLPSKRAIHMPDRYW